MVFAKTARRCGVLLLAAWSGLGCSADDAASPQAGTGGQAGKAGAGGASTMGTGGAGGTQPVTDASTGGSGGSAPVVDGSMPDPGGDVDAGGKDAPVTPPPPDPVIVLRTGTLRLEVWGERTIRVLYGTTAPAPSKSLAVIEARPVTPFTLTENATTLTVATAKLRAQVDKSSGQVTFLDPGGSVILAEAANNSHQLTPVANGPGPFKSAATFTPKGGESFYGLGQHQQAQAGKMAYGGSTQLLQKNPGESSVPLLVSSGGWGILWDNPSVTTVDVGGSVALTSDVANLVDYYFMAGPKVDDVIASYRALTGDAPMFGRWAFGYWQSKDHYGSQNEVLGIASSYRSMQIPIDNVVQDWQYWGSNPWGSHQFSSSYPDAAAMFRTLHQTGFHAMISVWARFATGSANYDALKTAGALMTPMLSDGSTNYYDPFKPEGRSLYWQQMNTALFSKGVDGWWLDATEPELNQPPNWGEFRNFQTGMGQGAVVYNAYPLMTTTAVHDGQRATTSDKRVFILTRSAYAGMQRNGAVTWSGDITGDWATFKRQIPAGLNFSLSGLPYWTTDIGGYFLSGLGGPGSAPYTELFERWFQFGAFCPMFRTHGTGADRNVYSFGAAAQTVLLGVDQLRYRLLPYIYSLSWMVTHERYTMMRALAFDFASDPMALNIPDQYMFGPAILVNPVSDAGATTRSVYLPANTTWYDFWSGATLQGGQRMMAAAPIDHMPLYVRAGSILPMGPIVQYATEKPADPIELRIFRGADGAFTLYEDENDNYNYERGMLATIPMSWNDAAKTLTIGARQGSFAGMLQNRTFRVVFVSSGHGSGTAETATADQTVMYSGTAVQVTAP
jgi:alpha-D-xyloside xylohydrolase